MVDLPCFLSTADVPPQHLKTAMLVGTIPFKALKSEPRVSYTLYIPGEHYNPNPGYSSLSTTFDSVYRLPLLPLVVSIHGTGRNAEKCRDCLKAFAHSERVAVLAPLFPAGIDSYTDADNYKLLRYKSLRVDLALLSILDEVSIRWPGITTQKVFMMGFSGGGQFAHRFMYLHSERLSGISIGAPGRVTALDENLRWPDGIQGVEEIFGPGVVVDRDAIKRLPIQLVAGGEDNMIPGGNEFWEWLKEKKKELGEKQDSLKQPSEKQLTAPRKGRLDTLEALQIAWEEAGISSTLDVVNGVEHDSQGVLDVVLAFLRPLIGASRR